MFHCKLPITPIAKGRPRVGRFSVYTPKKTRDAENTVRHLIAMQDPYLHLGPLKVNIIFYLVKPKKPKHAQFPISRPDLDNFAKLILDSCNGVVWVDDAQIVEMSLAKVYAGHPLVELLVREKEADA